MNLPRILSNNTTLPTLNGFAARSTWLILVSAVLTILNSLGIDLAGALTEIGIGGTPEQIVASAERVVSAWQIVAPYLLGLWAWIERRAPNFRLVWPWTKSI